MIRTTIATLVAALIGAAATACEPTEAEARWLQAEAAGIVLGAGMYGDVPTFQVDGPTWALMDLDARHGMAETFECVIAGPGNVLSEAQILDNGGEVLARWDGITSTLKQ